MSNARPELEELAKDFAESLTATVRVLAPDCSPFRATVATRQDGAEVFAIRQDPEEGISLRVGGVALLNITVRYFGSVDRANSYLAVDESKIAVYAQTESRTIEPLFRYEYDRVTQPDKAAAHIQFHAHRHEFAYVMAKSGTGTPRGARRSRSDHVPRLSEIHFPLGGHRFRPCLEDVLEMLVHEFGVDHTSEALELLRSGREQWRRMQLRSAVRDAPGDAVEVLETLGYVVQRPETTALENTDRLREL